MTRLSSLLALCLLCVSLFAADTLHLIAVAETRVRHDAVGDSGLARGAWQIHLGTWSDACRRLGVLWPHRDAHDPTRGRIVAANHLQWLERQFRRKAGRRPDIADLYCMWNLGLTGYARIGFDPRRAPEETKAGLGRMPR